MGSRGHALTLKACLPPCLFGVILAGQERRVGQSQAGHRRLPTGLGLPAVIVPTRRAGGHASPTAVLVTEEWPPAPTALGRTWLRRAVLVKSSCWVTINGPASAKPVRPARAWGRASPPSQTSSRPMTGGPTTASGAWLQMRSANPSWHSCCKTTWMQAAGAAALACPRSLPT